MASTAVAELKAEVRRSGPNFARLHRPPSPTPRGLLLAAGRQFRHLEDARLEEAYQAEAAGQAARTRYLFGWATSAASRAAQFEAMA